MEGYTCMISILVILLVNIASSQEKLFQGFRLPCNNTSPQCIKNSLQAVWPDFARGVPSLGIEPLDPLILEKVDLEMPGGLNIQFRQGYSKGFRKCVIDSANIIGSKFNVKLYCNITIKGKYKSYGRMLLFPIDGEGDAKIICKNISLVCSINLGTMDLNGEKYLEIKNYDVKYNYEGQVFYEIHDLFKGNPQLSNIVLEFMNQNWRAVSDEFGGPIVNYGVNSVLTSIKKLLKMVPKGQLIRRM